MTGDDLALTMQVVLTGIVRLRANRDIPKDAAEFRAKVLEALRRADSAARQKGYSADEVKLAVFAVVALLDETVLNSKHAVFVNWHKETLAQVLFNTVNAGNLVFDNIQKLLTRDSSPHLLDVLEVYYICLLLGFCGRCHVPDAAELAQIKADLAAKIYRDRTRAPLFKKSDGDAANVAAPARDPWVRRLVWSTAAMAAICLVVFFAFQFQLSSGVNDVRAIADQVKPLKSRR